MKTFKKFPVWFSRQGLNRKLFLGGMGLLLIIGMCSLMFIFFTPPEPQSPAITATFKGADSVVLSTRTPTPTNLAISNGSPTHTRTPLPTGLPTQSLETATIVVLPATLSAATTGVLVLITAVDKQLEYVDIQNAGGAPVSLSKWVLVSETGNQSCRLRGILQSKEVLRIWAGTGQVGLSCGFKNPIWLNQEPDPAVLYNADGEEVSRFP